MNDLSAVESIFLAALEKGSPEERAAYLAEACGHDPQLRGHVERLLNAHPNVGSFLKVPAAVQGITVDELPIAERPGTIIGPYKLMEQLGEGGMGLVFVAEQQQPVRRKVALKVIKPGMDSRDVIARFEAERQALALMDHPNIAKVLDAGTTDSGLPYFVMELVKGIPINDYCDHQQLNPRERLELFVQVCQAVQHAHTKGIIHRDLKPSNVLVAPHDGTPVVKVIDFGVAKAVGQQLTEKTIYTRFAQMIGTPLYMSPEQAEINALDVDTRSDVYSLGVLLYELLTGTTPFDRVRLQSAAFDEIRRIIREEEPPRPSTRLSTLGKTLSAVSAKRRMEPGKLSALVRGDLDWIVMKALEKDRTRRYETASSLAKDVQRFLSDAPVEARPPSVWYRFRKFARRNRVAVFLTSFIAATVLAQLINHWMGIMQLRQERDRALVAEEAARAERDRAVHAERLASQRLEEVAQQMERAEQAELKARNEAAVAGALNDLLLHDLLGQADLGQQPGGAQVRDPDIKVRTLLDRAGKALERRFVNQPLTEAAVRLTIGDAYGTLGRYEEAQVHLERAAHLRATLQGAEHPDTRHAKTRLALLAGSRGDLDKAEKLLQEVLREHASQQGADHRDTLHGKHDLAKVYEAQGKYDEAEKLFEEALSGYSKLGWEPSHPSILESQRWLAQIHYRRGQHERAESILQEVVKARALNPGADHPQTLYTKMLLATVYDAHGKHNEAEPLFQEVLDAYTTKMEADHPALLQTQHNLAASYYRQGKYERAAPLFRAAAEGHRRKFGVANPHTHATFQSWVTCAERVGQLAEAEPLCRELIGYWKQQTGDDALEYSVGQRASLGRILLARNQPAEAETVLRECLAAGEGKNVDPIALAVLKSLLGAALLGQKKYAEAEPLLRRDYDGLKRDEARLPPEARFRVTEALDRVVQLYKAWGKPDEAAKWQKVLDDAKKGSEPRSPMN